MFDWSISQSQGRHAAYVRGIRCRMQKFLYFSLTKANMPIDFAHVPAQVEHMCKG